MIVIGLTGGVGAGKDEAARVFKKMGAVIINADEVGHRLLEKSTPVYQKIVKLFGLGILNPDGEIIGVHRKNTLTSDDESAGYSSMRNDNVINLKDFRAGLMICADVNGKWLTEKYIDADIDIVLSAFASPIGLPAFNLISRRMDAWQIFPNRYGNEDGDEYSGLIYISDPAGNIINHQIGSESYFIYTIVK